jgi:hypothetical protein
MSQPAGQICVRRALDGSTDVQRLLERSRLINSTYSTPRSVSVEGSMLKVSLTRWSNGEHCWLRAHMRCGFKLTLSETFAYSFREWTQNVLNHCSTTRFDISRHRHARRQFHGIVARAHE